jgi:hypothetical protein
MERREKKKFAGAVSKELTTLIWEVVKMNEEVNRGSEMEEIGECTWKSFSDNLKQCPPSVNKEKYFDAPGGINTHVTRQCDGNRHDSDVVNVTSSRACHNRAEYAAKSAADLKADSYFASASRGSKDDIWHARNNWLCYNFDERRLVPTRYAFRWAHAAYPRLWLAKTLADGRPPVRKAVGS